MKNSSKALAWLALPILLIAFFIYRQYNVSQRQTNNGSSNGVACTEEYAPVCGSDNRTYSNSCEATQISKVQVAYEGVCGSPNKTDVNSDTPTTPSNTGTISNTGATNSTGWVNDSYTGDSSTGINTNTSSSSPVANPPMTFTGSSATGATTGSGENLNQYFNEANQYGFSLPKNTYYMGFGAQNGANHSVGIKSGTGVENFADADVRVFFFKNKVLPELENTAYGFYQEENSGKTFLKLGVNSAIIESKDKSYEEIVNTIIRTIHVK